jgi:hypothetical protein
MAVTNGTNSSKTAGTNSTDSPKTTGTNSTGIWSTDMWGAIVVFMGLAVVVGVFFGAIVNFTHANDVVAVVGAVTGVVGTIVTAFFGIHATAKAGADASQKVADAGNKAADVVKEEHNKALAAAAYIPEGKADDFVKQLGISTP